MDEPIEPHATLAGGGGVTQIYVQKRCDLIYFPFASFVSLRCEIADYIFYSTETPFSIRHMVLYSTFLFD